MNAAETTLSLVLLIGAGYLLKGKISSKEQRDGIRTIILSMALPATIFIALVKIKFSAGLIMIPALALAFNLVMYLVVSKLPLQALFGLSDARYRTFALLIPSLAPGLSCFPFILEFSGEGTVAQAALADLGNKIFVLIIAYVIAMKWFLNARHGTEERVSVNLRDVLNSLINEPVNMVIAVAVLMLSLGLTYDSLPLFLRMSIDKVSLLMTPLVLVFIGMSVKFTWQQVRTIFSFLFLRAAIAFAVSALLLLVLPVPDLATALLIVVFPQSACSFWPYSHMAAVSALERKQESSHRTFDLDFAMNVIGCSLPFSVLLILLVYTSGSFFAESTNVFLVAAVLLALAVTPALVPIWRAQRYANVEK
ncbi:MAG: permease [Bacteroidia bacterium]|nr:permease [Bacteroidia bacterium]